MKRELHLTVVVSHEALAGCVEYMRAQKIYPTSMSEAVGLSMEMLYGTLLEENLTRPIANITQALEVLVSLGLKTQKIQRRGLLKVEKSKEEDREEIESWMRQYDMTEAGAIEMLSLEKKLPIKGVLRKEVEPMPEIRGEVPLVSSIPPHITKQMKQDEEEQIVKDPKPMPSAFAGIPPEMLAQMARDEEEIRKERGGLE